MKIICIGRNYKDHALELRNRIPKKPVFFLKPDTALLPKKNPFIYPSFTSNIQHEVEIVIRICRLGKHIEEKFAHKYYNEIGIGVDFTARDIQSECKEQGLPWEKSKAFDSSAPVSGFTGKKSFDNTENINFSLSVNGVVRQSGNTKDMLFNFDQIIAYVSKFMTLKIGDLIFTGTPSGVGEVQIGDQIECFIEEKSLLKFNVK